jgi:hypothetical protein|tara:strand:- start:517 stop:882 length:366 start_codon:yes stop_codon:yes gene_type:complete
MKEASSQKATPGYNAATGTSNPGFDKFTTKYSGNQHTKTNPDAMINKGRGPTVGNKSDKDSTYPSARPLAAVTPGKDMFKGAPQVRTPGGTRAWDPKCEQNYKGNPDKMNEGRGPTKGNMK